MIVFRSGRDAGFNTRVQDIIVRRLPEIDGRMPYNYRNEFLCMEQMRYLPNSKKELRNELSRS